MASCHATNRSIVPLSKALGASTDFDIGRRLTRDNLTALRRVGFATNRRLLDVERLSHDCAVGDTVFTQLHRPIVVNAHRASAFRFGEPRVQMLLGALVSFRLLPRGFSHRELKAQLALLAGEDAAAITTGRVTYDLRRLRLHGLITRVPATHRYRLTDFGLRAALFSTRSYARLIRPGLALVTPPTVPGDAALRRTFQQLERATDHWCALARLAA